ncbi:MAG: Gfo/Idh/MocA family oxidoreductase [Betaproteobacteria bacterium]
MSAGAAPPLRFAAIGLDHRHIYDQVQSLLDIGGTCVGYWTDDDARPLEGFIRRFPQIPRVADRRALLDDPSIRLFTCAAVFDERADLAIEAMRAGKDFMADKPGVTTLDQLARVRAVQAETRRIWTVNFTERFEVRAVTRALELTRAGAIGEVVQTVGLGPHRENRQTRAPWFYDKRRYGGILADIGSHQIDQFLMFTGADEARIDYARAANVAHPGDPMFEDTGEMVLAAGNARGFVQVHWFTADGLSTWGDGRLFVVGTEGTIELRKYVDIAGRPGKDHLFLVDRHETRHIDCTDADLPYYANLARDVVDRTETAMAQAHAYKVCELALRAQAMADAAGS